MILYQIAKQNQGNRVVWDVLMKKYRQKPCGGLAVMGKW